VIAAALAVALWGGWAPTADAAFVGKRAARTYLLHAVPRGAPRVMLRDERAAFFHTARLWIEPSSGCDRAAAGAVSCQMRAQLLPDAAHRKSNWWPITCSGAVLVERMADGRLKGSQQQYVCRTVRPAEKPATG
jgi:hypothetical protein